MPFSEFGRPKADLNIRVSRGTLEPGDELDARVELLPREDFHVRLGKVELVRLETYIQTVRHQYGVSYHKRTHAGVVASETFMENQIVRRLGGSSDRASFVLPQDAIPTLSGSIFQKIQPGITWEIRALLDVTRARDMRYSQELTVVGPPVSDDRSPLQVATENRHRQCNLTLDLSRSEARSGDRIDGVLRVEMLDDVEVTEVRVELVRVEKFGNEGQDHVVDKAVFERDATLRSGDGHEWRFDLDVGSVKVPSLEAEKSSVTWLVKGILDRRMRRDLRVEREISVSF